MGTGGSLTHAQRRLSKEMFAHAFAYLYGEQLPGRPDQRIDQESLTQNFVIGSRRVVGMTVYHYAKMLAGATVDTVAKQTNGLATSIDLIEQQTTAVAIAAGTMTIEVVNNTAVVHQFQNGRINIWPTPPLRMQVYDIVDNDVNDGTNTRLYLRTPIVEALAASRDTSICPNIYSAVQHPSDLGTNLGPIVGVPNMFVTAGYYFWLATWGLVQIGQGEPLDGVGGPEVYFNPADGFAWKADTVLTANSAWQRAGHMAMEQTSGIDCDVILQLDP